MAPAASGSRPDRSRSATGRVYSKAIECVASFPAGALPEFGLDFRPDKTDYHVYEPAALTFYSPPHQSDHQLDDHITAGYKLHNIEDNDAR